MSKPAKPIVSFDNNGVGTVAEKAIVKMLPDGLTKEVFDKVDTFREGIMANVIHSATDWATNNDASSSGVTIDSIPLLGQATGQVFIDTNHAMVSEVSYKQSELMEAALLKSKELFDSKNQTTE